MLLIEGKQLIEFDITLHDGPLFLEDIMPISVREVMFIGIGLLDICLDLNITARHRLRPPSPSFEPSCSTGRYGGRT